MNTNITTQIKIKRLTDWAKIPEYATDGSGCFDIWGAPFSRPQIGTVIFKTGLSIEIPKGYALMLYSRSGHGFNHGIRLANCVGVIDSDYRGEINVAIECDRESSIYFLNDWIATSIVQQPFKIAQGMIIPVPQITFQEVEELSETVRGSGGFGSTGN